MPADSLKSVFPFYQPGAAPLPPVMLSINTHCDLLRPTRQPVVAVTDVRISRLARALAHPYLTINRCAALPAFASQYAQTKCAVKCSRKLQSSWKQSLLKLMKSVAPVS
jgi:hypothetical protein